MANSRGTFFWIEMMGGCPTVGVSAFLVDVVVGFVSQKICTIVIFCLPKRLLCAICEL